MYRVLEPQEKVAQETKSVQTSMSLKDGFAKFGGRVIIGLRTKGCSWARDPKGGCTHCAIPFSGLCSMDHINILPQFLEDFVKYNFEDYPVLCLYTPGSFFDDDEISPELRIQILEIISKDKSIKRLSIESRPDYLTAEKVGGLREILPDIEIEVGLGLDSADDRVRNLLINKGFSFENYVRACDILKAFQITIVTYVLVKPPYLSEKDCIIDGIETSKTAFSCGSKAVSIEPMSVQKDSIIHELYKKDLYKPPWLWSIMAVAKEVYSLGETRIGTFFYPSPIASSSNCKLCTQDAWQRIHHFNQTDNIKTLDMYCECQEDWKYEVDNYILPSNKEIE